MPCWKQYELGNNVRNNHLYFGHVQCIEIREEKYIPIEQPTAIKIKYSVWKLAWTILLYLISPNGPKI